MQHALPANTIRIKQRILAVRISDPVAIFCDDGNGIDPLPPEMARIHIETDIASDIRSQCAEAGRREHRYTGMQLEADHDLGCLLGEPLARLAPIRPHDFGHLPVEDTLIVR